MSNMTPEQCRAARALLGWTQGQLAAQASSQQKSLSRRSRPKTAEPVIVVSPTRVYRFERGLPQPEPECGRKMQEALTAAGVDFLFDWMGRPAGVQLAKYTAVSLPEDDQPLCSLHFRVARAWLNWSHDMLGEKAGVSSSTIRDFEKDRRDPHRSNLVKIELAIKLEGIRFLFGRGRRPIGISVLHGGLATIAA